MVCQNNEKQQYVYKILFLSQISVIKWSLILITLYNVSLLNCGYILGALPIFYIDQIHFIILFLMRRKRNSIIGHYFTWQPIINNSNAKYPKMIESYACTLKIFVIKSLLPINFINSSEMCATPKLLK